MAFNVVTEAPFEFVIRNFTGMVLPALCVPPSLRGERKPLKPVAVEGEVVGEIVGDGIGDGVGDGVGDAVGGGDEVDVMKLAIIVPAELTFALVDAAAEFWKPIEMVLEVQDEKV